MSFFHPFNRHTKQNVPSFPLPKYSTSAWTNKGDQMRNLYSNLLRWGEEGREAELNEMVWFGCLFSDTRRGQWQMSLLHPAIPGLFPGTCCLCPEAESAPHLAQRKMLPILRNLAKISKVPYHFLCVSVMMRWHSELGSCCLPVHYISAVSSVLIFWSRSSSVSVDCFLLVTKGAISRSQMWVRWLNWCCRSGLHLLALDFLTLHKHYFFAFIYTQV